MKNFIYAICLICSVNAFADELDVLDLGLDSFIKNQQRFEGLTPQGEKCSVSRFQSQVSVTNISPKCLRLDTGTYGPECGTRFSYHLRDARVKEYDVDYASLFAVVTQKDSEIYSSRETSQIEIKRTGKSTSFKVSDKKRLLGGYKNAIECVIR